MNFEVIVSSVHAALSSSLSSLFSIVRVMSLYPKVIRSPSAWTKLSFSFKWSEFVIQFYLSHSDRDRSSSLTLWSLVVTLCTTRFNIQQFCIELTWCLCVSYGYRNELQLLPYTTSAYWFFITKVLCVHCTVCTESLYIKQITFNL